MNQNFIVKAAKDGIAEIDIFGDIGEDWWTGAGNTIESVKSSIAEAVKGATKLKVNVSSLGGDVNEGFAIHDYIRTLNIETEANLTGWTASAGTIVALACDTVLASENIMFLGHESWTGMWGNKRELRATADVLEKVDENQIRIYQRKSGKAREEVIAFMEKGDWLTAEEAKEFGLIDEVYEPLKAVATAKIINKINSSKKLPKINSNQNQSTMEIETQKVADTVFAKIKDYFTAEKKEVSEEKLTEVANAKAEEIKAEFQEVITAAENKLTEETEKLNGKIEAKDTEISDLKEKLAKAEIKKSGTPGDEGKNPDGGSDGKESESPMFDALAEKFKARFGKRN